MKKKSALLFASSSLALAMSASGPAFAEQTQLPSPPIMKDAFEVTDVPSDIGGEIVVDFKDDTSDADIQALGDKLHIVLRDNSPGIKDDGKINLADVDPDAVDAIMARLAEDSHVEGVERAATAQMFFTPNDPKYGEQW